jgi:hypothetical protein
MTVRRLPPLVLALVLGLLTAVAVACGDGGDDRRLLGPRSAEKIRDELDKIEERVARGECPQLDPAFQRLDEAIAALPSSTDGGLRRRLAQGSDHLQRIAPRECRDNQPETTATQPETTTTTTPETVPTTPPETVETTPPETTTTPPETTTTPPEEPDEPVLPDDTGGDEAPGAGLAPGQVKKGEKG